MAERGTYIVAEGPDGSGKSTVARHIADKIAETGKEVFVTREPGGNHVSEAIRDIVLDPKYRGLHPHTEIALFTASRSELWYAEIQPRLMDGVHVVSDRNYTSSIAYQGIVRGFGVDNILTATRIFVGEQYMNPDITLVIQPQSYEVALARMYGREALDRLEQEGLEFHKQVWEAYELLCRTAGRVAINGSNELEVVKAQSWKAVSELVTRAA